MIEHHTILWFIVHVQFFLFFNTSRYSVASSCSYATLMIVYVLHLKAYQFYGHVQFEWHYLVRSSSTSKSFFLVYCSCLLGKNNKIMCMPEMIQINTCSCPCPMKEKYDQKKRRQTACKKNNNNKTPHNMMAIFVTIIFSKCLARMHERWNQKKKHTHKKRKKNGRGASASHRYNHNFCVGMNA